MKCFISATLFVPGLVTKACAVVLCILEAVIFSLGYSNKLPMECIGMHMHRMHLNCSYKHCPRVSTVLISYSCFRLLYTWLNQSAHRGCVERGSWFTAGCKYATKKPLEKIGVWIQQASVNLQVTENIALPRIDRKQQMFLVVMVSLDLYSATFEPAGRCLVRTWKPKQASNLWVSVLSVKNFLYHFNWAGLLTVLPWVTPWSDSSDSLYLESHPWKLEKGRHFQKILCK